MTAKHTPGEWKLIEAGFPLTFTIKSADGKELLTVVYADLMNSQKDITVNKARALFTLIVQTHNSHAALLAACKLAERVLTHTGITTNVRGLFGATIIEEIQSAILPAGESGE